jgi:hypothetical protein
MAVIAAVVALSIGGLAACSSSQDVVRADSAVASAAPLDALQRAGDKTTAATTAKISMTLDATGVPGLDTLNLAIDGAVDNQAHRSAFTTDISKLLASLPAAQQMAVSAIIGDGKVQVVTDGSNVYAQLGGLATILGATSGKPWIEISGDKAATEVPGASLGDGSAILKLLDGAGGVTKVGTEQVRGTDTTHYSGSLDIATALATLSADDRAKAESELGKVGIDPSAVKVPVDVWIDNDDMVRRVRIGVDPGTEASSGGPAGTFTMELYDFGQPVNITVPSPDQVFTVDPSMLSGLANLGSALGG